MKKRRLRKAALPALVLGGLMLLGALGASPAAAATDTIIKSGPATVTAGNTMTYTIQVINTSGATDHSVVVTDTLDAKVDYVSDDLAVHCTGAPNLTCNLGDMANGASVTFSIVVKVKPGAVGTISNSATVDGADTTSAPSNTVVTTIDTSADLAVSKTCTPGGTIPAGSSGSCEIIVHNNGPSTASNVTLTDSITGSGSYAFSHTVTGGGSCLFSVASPTPNTNPSQTTMSCTWASVLPGAANDVKVTLTFTNNTTQALSVNDSASVSSDTNDANGGNNGPASAGLSFAGPSADLQLTKVCKPDTTKVPVGGTGTCTITIHNFGPSDATTVSVTDQISASGPFLISGIVFTPAGGVCLASPVLPASSTTLTCTGLGPIPSGGEKTIAISFVPATAGNAIDIDDTRDRHGDSHGSEHRQQLGFCRGQLRRLVGRLAGDEGLQAGHQLGHRGLDRRVSDPGAQLGPRHRHQRRPQ